MKLLGDQQMTDDELKTCINLVRRDIGNLLFHFTHKPKDEETLHTPFDVLKKILSDGFLLGSSHWIR